MSSGESLDGEFAETNLGQQFPLRSAVVRGETAEQARKSVNLDELKAGFAGDSALRGLLFNSDVAGSGVSRA